MKLLFRLSLTLLSLLLFLMLAYLLLPSLAIEMARYKLSQQGFTEFEIKFGSIGLESATIEHTRLSNRNVKIELTGLKAEYQLMELLSGTADSIQIEKLSLFQLSAPLADRASAKANPLPSPKLLSGFLSLAWHEMMPANSLNIKNLSVYAEDGALSLSASAEFSKLGQSISAAISLEDSRHLRYQTRLEISPDTGIDLQLFSNREHPLSIKLEAIQGGNGLRGTIQLDLAQIAELIGQPERLTGLLQADISYYSNPGSPQTQFVVSAEGKQLDFADVQIQKIQADLKGHFMQQEPGYRLAFLPASLITMQFIQQGQNTLEELEIKLPQSLTFAEDGIVLSRDQGAEIKLSKLKLHDISVAQARVDNLDFTGFGGDESSDLCQFKMQLTTALIKTGDKRIEPAPIKISGSCPEREEQRWSIKANTEKLAYKDASYEFSLNRCGLQLGNSVQGKRLDSKPEELGGDFSCLSSQLSGELKSHFRFNPISNTGQATYSIAGITPDDEKPLISSVLKDWAQPFEIVSGSLSVKGSYRWWKNKQGFDKEKLVMDLQVIDAGGHYEGILFSGLNYRDSFELLPNLQSSDFSKLSVEHIDIAVPITRASANIRFSPSSNGELPVLIIDDLLLSLLDGRVTANDLEIDLNRDRQNLVFTVEGLDLAQIIAVQQLDGLTATGRLNGTVPVSITPKGIKITQGEIIAQDPGGRIRYIPAGEAAETGKSVPGSELVLKILEDLYYDSLSVDVDYDDNGQLRMKLSIKGKSPQVDAHRPIHFNLNLEQNLLTLLKGLRYTEGINSDIDNNVQKYFKEQKKSLN